MTENIVDALNGYLDSRLERVHTAVPGVIESYQAGTRLAKVRPMVKLQTGKGVVIDLPVIDNVPVIFPASAAFSLLWPLQRGDGVIIFFAENGIGNWINSPGTSPVAPDDAARFALTDAFCVPGLVPPAKAQPGKAQIEIDLLGLIALKNQTTGLLTLLEGLIDQIKAVTTIPASSGTSLTLNPATQAALEAYKLQLRGLLK